MKQRNLDLRNVKWPKKILKPAAIQNAIERRIISQRMPQPRPGEAAKQEKEDDIEGNGGSGKRKGEIAGEKGTGKMGDGRRVLGIA
jgi:hypothetical protein